MTKECPKCHIEKPLAEYYRRKTGFKAGKYYEKCKSCMKTRGRTYYFLNRERQLRLSLERKRRGVIEKRKFITAYKDKPCQDCGKRYPCYVMDLDHRDPKEKINEVASMVSSNLSIKVIEDEAQKCDVVCANCHRIRTHKKYAEVAKVVTAGHWKCSDKCATHFLGTQKC